MSHPESGGAVQWLRAHRVGLGPFYGAVPVLLLGTGLRFAPLLPSLVALLALSVSCVYWISRAPGWRRNYFAIALVIGLSWVLWLRTVDTAMGGLWMLSAWLFLASCLAIPWWADSDRRVRVSMETTVRNWPIRSARIHLSGTWLKNVRVTDVGWSAKLAWLPGAHAVEAIEARRGEIEGALGLQSNELRLSLDGRSTNSINLVVVTKDPHANPVHWDIPADEVDGGYVVKRLSVKDEFWIGVREDGRRAFLRLFVDGWGARQILIGGVKGSGKSGLLNLLWAYLSLCSDVVQWGIDLKGGMELGPWRSVFDWTVSTRAEALLMLQAANAEMERRQAYCESKGWKKWRVDKDHPILAVSIDEIASLLGNAKQSELHLFEELSRKGRACGIILIMATQYPTLDALGSSQIRTQIDQRFCFRMGSNQDAGYVIPDHRVDAHKIPGDRPGTCYHQDEERFDRMPMRVLYVQDEPSPNGGGNVVAQLVELLTGYTPTLSEEVEDYLRSIVPEYGERDTYVPVQRDGEIVIEKVASRNEMSRETNENVDETGETSRETDEQWERDGETSLVGLTAKRNETLTQAERDAEDASRRSEEEREAGRLSPEDAYATLVRLLQENPEGISPGDLMKATTRKSTWLYDNLSALETDGKAHRVKSGAWTWTRKDDRAA